MQILRTYDGEAAGVPVRLEGERSIARAYPRAFTRARRPIYIEDQYFWSDVVAATLAAALRREPELQVIAVVPRFPEKGNRTSRAPMLYGQRLAWNLLRDAGGDRCALFDLENADGTPIYVHAKVCVVDDQWMTIGSDNLNRRPWTHDSEVTCAVVDPGGDLPRSVRTSLWAEHLGMSQDARMTSMSDALALPVGRARGRPRQPHPAARPPALSALTERWARLATWPSTTLTADHEGCAARRASDTTRTCGIGRLTRAARRRCASDRATR